MPRRGVIYTVAPSYKDVDTIWAGTDDGLIHVTRDGGKTWTERDAAGPDGVEQGLADRRRPASTPTPPTPRSTASASTTCKPHIYRTHDGGKTWTGDRPRPARTTRSTPCARTRCGRGCSLRHRAGGLRLVQRRRRLAAAAAEHAVHVDPRPGRPRRRPGRRHARPIVLDPRRHLAAAADRRRSRGGAGAPVRAGGGHAGPLEPEHRHAAAARRAGRQEPAGRRDHRLLARQGRGRAGAAGDPRRRAGQWSAASAAPTGRRPVDPDRLQIRPDWVRPPQVLSAKKGMHRFVWDLHSAAGRRAAELSDLRHPRRHADRAAGPVGHARQVHRAADGRRQDRRAAADRPHGPAGDDAGGGVAGAVPVVGRLLADPAADSGHRAADSSDPRTDRRPAGDGRTNR